MNLEKLRKKQMKLKKGGKKIMKTKIKQERGITLIALVVTIVVLLILAGVSVNALFGNSGIIEKAKESQNKMEEAQRNDLTELNKLNEWIGEVSNSSSKSESESNIPTINLTGTSWKIPTNAFVSSTTEGCYILDLSIKKIDSSGTQTIMDNYISTYLRYYTSSGSSLIQFSGGSFNNESQSQPVKYLDFSATHYIITINGGRDANNETLADWLNTYGENITDSQ